MTSQLAGRGLTIGISACFFPADPQRAVFKGKTLLYLVQPMSDWIQSQGALAFLLPTLPSNGPLTIRDQVAKFDALLLQGGSDVSPKSYGETPLKPEWSGDFERDQYEIALVREFRAQCKPVLGICRGLQLLNVAFGGTLYQDITTQVPGAGTHRNWDIYDQNFHEAEFEVGSSLRKLYEAASSSTAMASGMDQSGSRFCINSVHHQAIKDLARGLEVEARSVGDGIIEAARFPGDPYTIGVQWHPEFQSPADGKKLLDPAPLLLDFLRAAKGNRKS